MPNGYIVRLRPRGPWRIGPDNGAPSQSGDIYHSDSLYAAVCSAMLRLGALDEWLDATARRDVPVARFSSAFPWMDSHLYVTPPRTHWPVMGAGRMRTSGARFIPLDVMRSLLGGRPLEEDRWEVDGASGCLISRHRRPGQAGPFRFALRSAAAVDRVSGGGLAVPHQAACVEFAANAGLWFSVEFADAEAIAAWWPRLQAALRWLADSGFGAKRSAGWGHCEIVELRRATIGGLVAEPLPELPKPAPSAEAAPVLAADEEPAGDIPMAEPAAAMEAVSETYEEAAPAVETEPEPGTFQTYWLLSLYSPAPSDEVNWSRGSYSLAARGGRVESPSGWGAPKRLLRMVREGSVLFARQAPAGRAVDVAPEGFPHPVYRAGFAVAVPVPWRVNA
jgi:CRISPR type III-A-associated RAMP protein Csm4